MSFKTRYLEMKKEYKIDREIAKEMEISISLLVRLKNLYGLTGYRCPNRNYQGLTQEELEQGVRNGIPRRLALRRVREYGYSVEMAISSPKRRQVNKRGGK
jgi:hypothetical protein